jgi:hypothetical protein
MLCHTCYERFRRSGTIERSLNRLLAASGILLPHSKATGVDLKPRGQVAAEWGGRAGKRKAACQDGDMRGKGDKEGRTELLHASMDADWWDTPPPGDQPDTQGSERKAHKKKLMGGLAKLVKGSFSYENLINAGSSRGHN